MPLDSDVDLVELAALTEGYSGSDLESVCREAGMLALREAVSTGSDTKKILVGCRYWKEALEKVRPSIELPHRFKDYDGGSISFEELNALPPEERERFKDAAEKAAEMLSVEDCTVSFRSPVGTSAEIGGKVYLEPSQTVLSMSNEGLTGLFLHEFGHRCFKMLNREARRMVAASSEEAYGEWAVKLLEDLFVNDLLHSRGLSRFLTATDIDTLKMVNPSINRFEASEAKTSFFLALSVAGAYLDGKRYGNQELVELTEQRLSQLPIPVREAVLGTYDLLRSIPVHREPSDSRKWDSITIGRELASQWRDTLDRR
jgi:hypothetical protein